MQAFKVAYIAGITVLLLACSSPEQDVSLSIDNAASDTEKTDTAKKRNTNPHNIQGMKKVMDDARAVEALLQRSHDERQKEINKY